MSTKIVTLVVAAATGALLLGGLSWHANGGQRGQTRIAGWAWDQSFQGWAWDGSSGTAVGG